MSVLPLPPVPSNPLIRLLDLFALARAISLQTEARRMPRALIERLIGRAG